MNNCRHVIHIPESTRVKVARYSAFDYTSGGRDSRVYPGLLSAPLKLDTMQVRELYAILDDEMNEARRADGGEFVRRQRPLGDARARAYEDVEALRDNLGHLLRNLTNG